MCMCVCMCTCVLLDLLFVRILLHVAIMMILWITTGKKCTSVHLFLTTMHSHIFCMHVCSQAIRYCFGPLIQKQLEDLVYEWNHHRIRNSRNSETPGGIPEVLYFLPEQSGK